MSHSRSLSKRCVDFNGFDPVPQRTTTRGARANRECVMSKDAQELEEVAGSRDNDGSHGGAVTDGGRDMVTIFVNNTPREIHRGRRTVEEIKRVGGVATADELEQVIEGKLTPLADNASIVIKGDERFVSHPRDSGSSHEAGRA